MSTRGRNAYRDERARLRARLAGAADARAGRDPRSSDPSYLAAYGRHRTKRASS